MPSLAESGFDFFEGHTIKSDRYFRYEWELPASTTLGNDRTWARLFNGAPYSPFYYPLSEVVPYGKGAEIIAAHPGTVLRNKSKHLRGGICFGKRGEFVDAHILPAGFVSTVEGRACPVDDDGDRFALLGILNSRFFQFVINMYCGQHKYGGYVGLFPFPGNEKLEPAAHLCSRIAKRKALAFGCSELSPGFAGFHARNFDDGDAIAFVQKIEEEISELEVSLNQHVYEAYGLSAEDVALVEHFCERCPTHQLVPSIFGHKPEVARQTKAHVRHWLLGIAFGRYSSDLCGANENEFTSEYAISTREIESIGNDILVDDEGGKDDVEAAIRKASISADLNTDHELISTRAWLRKPAFDYHLQVFSAGSRKAPIYWQLATPSASYSVWCYYHRLSRDTFFRVANDYVTPKVDHEERKLNTLRQEAGPEPSSKQRKEIDVQETFVDELRTFLTEVDRIKPLWNPNLNDGVIINFAPLWRLVPQHKAWQKECKKVWDTLCKGDYDWAHLAMHLWPERVVPKCQDDRSLAIAHGLEDDFWYEDDQGKKTVWTKRQVSQDRVAELVAERSSTAVKAALEDLLSAPTPSGSKRRARRGGS